MSYLLDTNVVSELRKSSPDANVEAWYDSVPGSQLFVSVLTIGEIERTYFRGHMQSNRAPRRYVRQEFQAYAELLKRNRHCPGDRAALDGWVRK